MRTKGTGPQGLGVKGNNGYHIGSPAKFEAHEMHSKSGKTVIADTNKEHLALKKKNYTHTSPAKCWKGYERVPGTKKNAKGSCKKK
jgi:hypothetical protein